MIELTLSIWLSYSGLGPLQPGDVLPAGIHPASKILEACQALDEQPLVLELDDHLNRPVKVPVDLRIHENSLPSLDILLRSAGLHRVSYADARGSPYTYITRNPKKPPSEALPYDVAILELRHLDAQNAAKILNSAVERRERQVPDGQVRTRFIPGSQGRQLVIRFSDDKLLEHYLRLLSRVDTPPETERLTVLRSYLCRHTVARDLAREFGLAWDKRRGQSITIVPNRKTNSILLRLPGSLWREAEEMLKKLDQPEIKK